MMERISKLIAWPFLTCWYVYLFSGEAYGYNTAAFSFVATGFCIFQNREMLRTVTGRLAIAAHFMLVIALCLHSGFLLGLCYHGSMFILTGMAFATGSNPIVAFMNGLASRICLSTVAGIQSTGKLFENIPLGRRTTWRQTALYVGPVSVTLVFYFLYYLANPDFKFDIPQFRFDWGLFTEIIIAGLFVAPFVFPQGLAKMTRWDIAHEDVVFRKHGTGGSVIFENRQGIVMFGLLNILIAVFIAFSLFQICFPSQEGPFYKHSAEVHQSFNSVLVSIVMAIGLILYYFRGSQNFYPRNMRLKKLATGWIVLNLLLVMLTCYKNGLYVLEFGLTFKRIWVFAAMLATTIGLCLTYIKIFRLKSTWFLIKVNLWVVYLMLVSYPVVDWDRLIAHYNVNYARQTDWEYLAELEITAYPEIMHHFSAFDEPEQQHIKNNMRMFMEIKKKHLKTWQSRYLDDIFLQRFYEDNLTQLQ